MFPSSLRSLLLSQKPFPSPSICFGTTSSPPGSSATVDQPGYLGYLQGAVTGIWQKWLPWSTTNSPLETSPSTSDAEKIPTVKFNTVTTKTSRNEVTSRTNVLVKRLIVAESTSSRLRRIIDLCNHLTSFPATRLCAVENPRLISHLLELERSAADKGLRLEARLCLALCGYVKPPKGAGVNLLTIDGGGTKGMMGLEVLQSLEDASGGRKVHEMFDQIVGVSTGGIIAVMLGIKKLSVQDTKKVYMEISRQLFSQTKMAGVSGLLLAHSYYNTKKWVSILKEILGEGSMVESVRDPAVPRVSVVSCIVNLPTLQPFIFRNYEPPAGRESHYRGGTAHPLWQAVQVSVSMKVSIEQFR